MANAAKNSSLVDSKYGTIYNTSVVDVCEMILEGIVIWTSCGVRSCDCYMLTTTAPPELQ